MRQSFEYTVLELLDNSMRVIKAQPMNLGGLSGSEGGTGFPPGGFIGQLPQRQVAYDTTEAATLFTPMSGMSLLDNLNHIRYRIGVVESGGASALRVSDWDGNPTVPNVNHIVFSGATVINQGGGRVLIVAGSGGGGGGIDEAAADLLYLRLDTDNNPLTGQLQIIPDTNDEGGIYIETQGDAYPADFEQFGYGAETINVPNLFLYRGPGDGSNVHFNTHQIEVLDDAKPGSTGGFMKYTASGVILVNMRPKADNQNYQFRLLNTPTASDKILFQVYDDETDYFLVTPGGVYGALGALLQERSWFRINESDETIEFGVDVPGKGVNSGKIGYDSFGAGYLHIVGAGTGSDRKVKLYDKTYCDLFIGGVQIPSMANATMLGTDGSNNIIDNTSAGDDRWAPAGMYAEGWVLRTETWTRTGNHTFTLSGDYTNSYRKGVRVQYTDSGGVDYGTILSAVHSAGTTTVTLITNTNYSMASGSITNTYISYQDKPRFFPDHFNWTPSTMFATVGSGTLICRFFPRLDGFMEHDIYFEYGSGSSVTGANYTPPAPHNIGSPTGSRMPVALVTFSDASPATSYTGVALSVPTSSVFGLRAFSIPTTYTTQITISSTIPFTWTTGDFISIEGVPYPY